MEKWKANVDTRARFNHCKAITYIFAYFSKAEDETFEVMKKTAKEWRVSGKTDFEKMKAVARAYSTKRECSIQDTVHVVIPELRLTKTFPKLFF